MLLWICLGCVVLQPDVWFNQLVKLGSFRGATIDFNSAYLGERYNRH